MSKNPYAAKWFTVHEDRSRYIVLKANPKYWNKKRGPRLKTVIFRNDLTQEQALQLCMNTEGIVDIVTQVPPEKAQELRHSMFAKLEAIGGNRVVAGSFNRFQRDIDFSNEYLRLAFNYAVDRDDLIQRAFSGYATKVPALTPPWAFDFPEELKPIEHDPNKAKDLLKKGEWSSGRELRIAAPSNYIKVAETLANHFRAALHIEVAVHNIFPKDELKWRKVLAEKRLIPNWDIFIGSPDTLFYEGTPAYFHREFLGEDGALRSGPIIPQFEVLFNRMAAETHQKELLEKAKEIDRYVYHQALALFLCAPHDLYAVNKHVNFKPYRTTFELAETEVTSKHWSKMK
ncbi:ABC transporter substrate-binding protein [Bacillus salitolerans]|uniref:ABC transporter substrate-binding protein n=1 Tax=Bacillus salitolerans TaxID=1437434 RepID=A0ABW4LUR8_9BACI